MGYKSLFNFCTGCIEVKFFYFGVSCVEVCLRQT